MMLLLAGLALAGPVLAPRMDVMEPMGEVDHTEARVNMVKAGWSRLWARKRTLPTLPPGVPAAGERLRCTVRVEVDKAGKPSRVEPRDCDAAIRAATVDAAWDWRFAPHVEEGRPVPTETELSAVVVAPKGKRRSKR